MPEQMKRFEQRIDRALEHFESLKREVGEFLGSAPYEILADYDPDTRSQIWRAKILREPPLRLGFLVGDYIHNLSATMDNLMWQLGQAYGELPHSKLDFPIFDNREAYTKRFAVPYKRFLKAIPSEMLTYVEGNQPFKSPEVKDGFFATLRNLWIEDKHRASPVVLSVMKQSMFVHPGSSEQFELSIEKGPFEDGGVVARARLVGDAQPTVTAKITVGVGLRNGGVSEDFLPDLLQLYHFAKEYVLPVYGQFFPKEEA